MINRYLVISGRRGASLLVARNWAWVACMSSWMTVESGTQSIRPIDGRSRVTWISLVKSPQAFYGVWLNRPQYKEITRRAGLACLEARSAFSILLTRRGRQAF